MLLTFTFDLEDHRPDPLWPARYPMLTRRVLDWLDRRQMRGTFFVIGELAEESPDLVREVAGRGHELAVHGWRHRQLTRSDPAELAEDLRRAKALLEDLGGHAVVGYRAPTASLVPETVWATEVLADQGFTYSGSVIPAANPLYGFPGAPRRPFRWPSGVLEIPASPMAGLGPFKLPYLGGTYLRVLPDPVLRGLGALFPPVSPPGVYCHPYDFDPDEPYWREPEAGWLSPLLWVGRRRLWGKLDRLFADGATPPIGELVDGFVDAPIWHPPVGASIPV